VLLNDNHLFPAATDYETYVEFVAVYLELRYFAPYAVECYFPAIRDWRAVSRLVSQDVNHRQLYEQVRSDGLGDYKQQGQTSRTPIQKRFFAQSYRGDSFDLLRLKAQRAAAVGNSVKAVLASWHAAQFAPQEHRAAAEVAAHVQLLDFAER